MGKLLDRIDQPSVESWFREFDMPYPSYLKDHYGRFSTTHKFVSETLPSEAAILDIGAHFLHQAFFFANDGHTMTCADVPVWIGTDPVKRAAAAMGADLIAYDRLDRRTAFDAVPDNSVDGVLFLEIIEHITYNPIRMWEQIYRVLKPGGHIYVSTPNSMWFLRLIQKLEGIFSASEYGIDLPAIFGTGTYGHHWKEYSPPEIDRYFSTLSSDFRIARNETVVIGVDPDTVQSWYAETLKVKALVSDAILLKPLVEQLRAQGAQPFGYQILADIHLPEKRAGIQIAPPWET